MHDIKNENSIIEIDRHLPFLDGLRGVAALWVFISHSMLLTGSYIPILSKGELAVDLFMVLSGILITHNYLIKEDHEPWYSMGTWVNFWIRRVFRIAPIYYVMLVIAIGLGPWIGDWREYISIFFPNTRTPLERYTDQSITNIIVHISFFFGLLPLYSFRTPLPDWSIGLEMQFYAMFPLIITLMRLVGYAAAIIILFAVCTIVWNTFPNYIDSFSMPTFLLLKLDMFLVGILFGIGLRYSNEHWEKPFLSALIIPLLFTLLSGPEEDKKGHLFEFFIALGVGILVFHYRWAHPVIRWPVTIAVRVLASHPLRFMGDISYTVYLLHLLILIPVVGTLCTWSNYVEFSPWWRFILCLTLSIIPTCIGAWILHVGIERPAITLGRRIIVLTKKSNFFDRSFEKLFK
jgi:peptidoglycan/LPS O-acetylase OafA/YrhL